MFQIRDGRQSRIPLTEAVLRISFPIEGGVGLWAVERGEFREFRFSLVVVVFVQGFATIVVQFGVALQSFLFAVAFLLLAIPLFLFAVAFLLFAIPLFLLLVLLVACALFLLLLSQWRGAWKRCTQRRC